MKVFVFGNPDLVMDSLSLKILPDLETKFPSVEFVVQDPNEEISFPENVIILDMAVGIDEMTIFNDLEKFVSAPRVSMHDFDALTNLRLLKKLGKIKTVKIVAIPAGFDKKMTLSAIVDKVIEMLFSFL